MSRLIKASRRAFLSLSSPKFQFNQFQFPQIKPQISSSLFQSRNYISEMRKSIFYESSETKCSTRPNMHLPNSLLRNSVRLELMIVQGSRLKSKDEEITIEVTMFDGAVPTKTANGSDDTTLHISLVVNVVKGEDGETFQFVCSAWPDCMEVQKIFFVKPNGPGNIYMGPDFKDLDDELQKSLREFLEERGVDDDLASFLHEYMHNKDRIELIRWMGKVKSFVEK